MGYQSGVASYSMNTDLALWAYRYYSEANGEELQNSGDLVLQAGGGRLRAWTAFALLRLCLGGGGGFGVQDLVQSQGAIRKVRTYRSYEKEQGVGVVFAFVLR